MPNESKIDSLDISLRMHVPFLNSLVGQKYIIGPLCSKKKKITFIPNPFKPRGKIQLHFFLCDIQIAL